MPSPQRKSRKKTAMNAKGWKLTSPSFYVHPSFSTLHFTWSLTSCSDCLGKDLVPCSLISFYHLQKKATLVALMGEIFPWRSSISPLFPVTVYICMRFLQSLVFLQSTRFLDKDRLTFKVISCGFNAQLSKTVLSCVPAGDSLFSPLKATQGKQLQ